jgi:hypothetical protein
MKTFKANFSYGSIIFSNDAQSQAAFRFHRNLNICQFFQIAAYSLNGALNTILEGCLYPKISQDRHYGVLGDRR